MADGTQKQFPAKLGHHTKLSSLGPFCAVGAWVFPVSPMTGSYGHCGESVKRR